MGCVKIGNKVITQDLQIILEKIRRESSYHYLNNMSVKHDEIMFSCPFHKDGQEKHPSCSMHNNPDDDTHGIYHCFTCGSSGNLINLVSYCLKISEADSYEWLDMNYGDTFLVSDIILPTIEISNQPLLNSTYLDESILDNYKFFHPYMFQRGLTEDVIRKYKVGCTEDGKYITFPCWDEHDNLVGIYKRSTTGKEFIIPTNIKKCVYLLNFLIKEHRDIAYVCESQINALTLLSWGYPAIALFGTGTSEQYEILNRSGIRNFILCFDGDDAGWKGRNRFVKHINKSCFITTKVLPSGKDVNDLTKEDFDSLEEI